MNKGNKPPVVYCGSPDRIDFGERREAKGYVLVDLEKKVTVDHRKLHTSADYCVYDGWVMTGWPVATWLRGTRIMDEGAITARPGLGRWLAADLAPRGRPS